MSTPKPRQAGIYFGLIQYIGAISKKALAKSFKLVYTVMELSGKEAALMLKLNVIARSRFNARDGFVRPAV